MPSCIPQTPYRVHGAEANSFFYTCVPGPAGPATFASMLSAAAWSPAWSFRPWRWTLWCKRGLTSSTARCVSHSGKKQQGGGSWGHRLGLLAPPCHAPGIAFFLGEAFGPCDGVHTSGTALKGVRLVSDRHALWAGALSCSSVWDCWGTWHEEEDG